MCSVCGCAQGHSHSHHAHEHEHEKPLAEFVHIAEFGHVTGLSEAKIVKIEQDILFRNNQFANENRNFFAGRGILALNLVSSPGSGKTTLLVETIARMAGNIDMAVIEGDQQTNRDAERISATGVRAWQINTGKGCHLDAHAVGHALEGLQLTERSLLFIENVGNLVCPSAFDLGEAHKVVVLSVTEGEDKPLKYPDMFHAADLLILNKIDLLPYLDFDVESCIKYAKQINPRIKVLCLSAKSGDGFDKWLLWLTAELQLQAINYA